MAGNKSIESMIEWVKNRLNYGLIHDVFDLAATYGLVITVGHAFNDGNKRTTFAIMETCLQMNGITPQYNVIEAADMIIKAAQGIVDKIKLAWWLRRQSLPR